MFCAAIKAATLRVFLIEFFRFGSGLMSAFCGLHNENIFGLSRPSLMRLIRQVAMDGGALPREGILPPRLAVSLSFRRPKSASIEGHAVRDPAPDVLLWLETAYKPPRPDSFFLHLEGRLATGPHPDQ